MNNPVISGLFAGFRVRFLPPVLFNFYLEWQTRVLLLFGALCLGLISSTLINNFPSYLQPGFVIIASIYSIILFILFISKLIYILYLKFNTPNYFLFLDLPSNLARKLARGILSFRVIFCLTGLISISLFLVSLFDVVGGLSYYFYAIIKLINLVYFGFSVFCLLLTGNFNMDTLFLMLDGDLTEDTDNSNSSLEEDSFNDSSESGSMALFAHAASSSGNRSRRPVPARGTRSNSPEYSDSSGGVENENPVSAGAKFFTAYVGDLREVSPSKPEEVNFFHLRNAITKVVVYAFRYPEFSPDIPKITGPNLPIGWHPDDWFYYAEAMHSRVRVLPDYQRMRVRVAREFMTQYFVEGSKRFK